jgi:hypothetical protein
MEDDKICEVSCFLIFISKKNWLTNSNPNLVQSKNKNKLYYIVYIINIFIIPWI